MKQIIVPTCMSDINIPFIKKKSLKCAVLFYPFTDFLIGLIPKITECDEQMINDRNGLLKINRVS